MRYFWFVIFVLSVGSVSAQNSARVRELEKQRKAALAEIEMTSQLLDETRQTARNSLNRLKLLSKHLLSLLFAGDFPLNCLVIVSPHPGIQTARSSQFRMSTLLGNVPFFKNDNLISAYNSG